MPDSTSRSGASASPYLSPDHVCDLVMKGGITSGVVYPPAIDEIARRFWLSGIGGTSAGAIAAALAAAAELSRRNGSSRGYEQLNALPQELSGKGRMLMLFKADRPTHALFRLLTLSLEAKTAEGMIGRAVVRAKQGLVALRVLCTQAPFRRIADNGMGLCTGMALGIEPKSGELPPLTAWLSTKIDALAGKPPGAPPLTFGDLWSAPAPTTPGFKEAMGDKSGIYLQLVSTCLTFGRPYALPHLDNRFAFSPTEFRRLFPEYVVKYMETEGEKILARMVAGGKDVPPAMQPGAANRLLPLPNGAKLPVIVGVRMSLSFPVLFSTVPLHYVNYFQKPAVHEPVYFADGGITSNLPMYFFDSPVPRWPTLAINLQYCPTTGDYGRVDVSGDHVWMTSTQGDGTLELFNRFLSGATPRKKLFGLGGAIFRAAQVWSDNSFLTLPGYRDRVAEVWLDPHEGGMNLNMDEKVINDLVRHGRAAGQQLVHRFAVADQSEAMSWLGHRWGRYRAQMASLAHYLRKWANGIDHPLPGDPSLFHILDDNPPPPCYPFRSDSQRENAGKATADLRALIAGLDEYAAPDSGDAPALRPFHAGPKSALVLQGRYSTVPLATPRGSAPAEDLD